MRPWIATLATLCALASSCSRVVDRSCARSADFCPEGYCCIDGTCQRAPGISCELGEFVVIPSGTFNMGSPEVEIGHVSDEIPHRVTLTRDFEMLSIEVAQYDFQALMGFNPSAFSRWGEHGEFCPEDPTGESCPVDSVTWDMAAAFCNELSRRRGLAVCYSCEGSAPNFTCTTSSAYESPYECPGYRLPTEAEWEYAARADSIEATYNGDFDGCSQVSIEEECADDCERAGEVLDSIAWYCGNSGLVAHAGGQLTANDLGLHDMLGNMIEWCHDWLDQDEFPETAVVDPWSPFGVYTEHVVRGGSGETPAADCRSAGRHAETPDYGHAFMGFRPVRSILE